MNCIVEDVRTHRGGRHPVYRLESTAGTVRMESRSLVNVNANEESHEE